jgi:hypothetical protein
MNLKMIVIASIILMISSVCCGSINPPPVIVNKYETVAVSYELDYALPDLSIDFPIPSDKRISVIDMLFFIALFGMYMVVVLDMTFKGDKR